MTVTGTSTDPASWQQLARLADEAAYGGYDSIWNLFEIPLSLPAETVLDRLAAVVARESALRIIGAGRSADGDGWVRYSERLALPVQRIRCADRDEAIRTARTTATERFSRDGQPAWRCTLLEYPADGQTRLLGCVALDHFVSDGRSMDLLQRELADPAGLTGVRFGDYRQWLDRQRDRFPLAEARHDSEVQRFWRAQLDGNTADNPTELDFASTPPDGHPEQITSLNFGLPLSMAEVKRQAAGRGVTPFLLVLAAVAATAAGHGDSTDLTMRLISSGRQHRYLGSQGWFADSLPIRLRGADLTRFDDCLATVRQTWSEILQFHDTPLGYIRAACGPAGIEPVRPRGQQLVLNFVPHDLGGMYPPEVAERTAEGNIDGLHLILLADQAGLCRIGAMFSPAHFRPDGVRGFVADLTERLGAVLQTTDPVPSAPPRSVPSC